MRLTANAGVKFLAKASLPSRMTQGRFELYSYSECSVEKLICQVANLNPTA